MKTRQGYFLIEALLSIVIFSVLILSIFSMISFLQNRTKRSNFESEASILLQDGMEIAHSALLADWDGYPEDTYFPALDADSNTWLLLPGVETDLQARYTRSIEVKDVCRDVSTGEIIRSSCVGEIDEISKEIVTTLSWKERDLDQELTARLLILNTNE
jgi:Tfp pilus assembly protein PilV